MPPPAPPLLLDELCQLSLGGLLGQYSFGSTMQLWACFCCCRRRPGLGVLTSTRRVGEWATDRRHSGDLCRATNPSRLEDCSKRRQMINLQGLSAQDNFVVACSSASCCIYERAPNVRRCNNRKQLVTLTDTTQLAGLVVSRLSAAKTRKGSVGSCFTITPSIG